MLKKLYKYEFYSLFRILLPIYAALLGFAVLSKITFSFNIENEILDNILGLSAVLYVFAIIAVFIVGFVVVIMRFYKNLLSHEGYLTFTLPFKPSQHIICKLLSGVSVIIVNFIAVICSLLVLGAGTDSLKEILSGIGTGLDMLIKHTEIWKILIIGTELLVLCLLSVSTQLLMIYASISVGQQFKNRIGGAVLIYVCFYAAVQTITSVIMVLVMSVTEESIEQVNILINSVFEVSSIFLFAVIIWQTVLCLVYYFISRYFLTKKLNLE